MLFSTAMVVICRISPEMKSIIKTGGRESGKRKASNAKFYEAIPELTIFPCCTTALLYSNPLHHSLFLSYPILPFPIQGGEWGKMEASRWTGMRAPLPINLLPEIHSLAGLMGGTLSILM